MTNPRNTSKSNKKKDARRAASSSEAASGSGSGGTTATAGAGAEVAPGGGQQGLLPPSAGSWQDTKVMDALGGALTHPSLSARDVAAAASVCRAWRAIMPQQAAVVHGLSSKVSSVEDTLQVRTL